MQYNDVGLIISFTGVIVAVIMGVHNMSRNRITDTAALERRVTDMEVKVGLFWHLIEEHTSHMLPKANPIHLSVIEAEAAAIYDKEKASSPTSVLELLNDAIERELRLKYLEFDEQLVFTLQLTAIKAQLYDRQKKVRG